MISKSIHYLSFTMFSFFYLLTSTRIAIPGITILRWVGSIFLMFSSFISQKDEGRWIIRIPLPYLFIFIALIPTFLGLGGNGTVYAYQRIFSLFLVLFSLEIFIQNDSLTFKDKINCIQIFTFIANLLMLYSIIFPNYANGRMTGAYQNANFISCIALYALSSSILFFIYNKKIITKISYFIFSMIDLFCIIQSGSRIGFVLSLITLICFMFISKSRMTLKELLKILITFTVFVILISYALDHFDFVALDRFKTLAQSGAGLTRGNTWEDVFKIFSTKPLLGWGYGQVGYNVFEIHDTTYHWGMHSSYFVILCEMGIVGTFLFILFFLSYYKKIIVGVKKCHYLYDKSCAFILKGMLLTSILMLINGYSEAFLFSVGNPMSICFWLPLIFTHNLANNIYLSKKGKVWKDINNKQV